MDFESGRFQGWCPVCGLRSAEARGRLLVCNSPQCGWESPRTAELELEIRSEPPVISESRLNDLRKLYDLSPVLWETARVA